MAKVIQTSSGTFASDGLIGMQIENPLITVIPRVVGLPLILFGLLMLGVGVYFVFTDTVPDIGEAVGFWGVTGAIFLALFALFMFLGIATIIGSVGLDLLLLRKPDTIYIVLVGLFLFAAAISSWTSPMGSNPNDATGFFVLLYTIALGSSYFIVTLRNLRLKYAGSDMVAKHLQEAEAKALVTDHQHLIGQKATA
ncbi:MAG: hypothetical protein ABJ205_06435 [Erythrobacter sp.]|uniref:hypothetical protein n=1 Tax=Erythrobacter sp. TaxID=1042 RepID=UPI00326786B4